MLVHPGLFFLDADQSLFFFFFLKSHELNKEEHVTSEGSRIGWRRLDRKPDQILSVRVNHGG